MSSKSWYVLKSKAVPTRYGLTKNIQDLLRGLDDYYLGAIDDVELGRLVRLSARRRTSIANTITTCAGIIKEQPEELKTCLDIIEMCTELLEIAERRPPTSGFPFMRLPIEIRERILYLMIDNVFRTKSIIPANKTIGGCKCPQFDRDTAFQTTQMKGLPSLLGQALNLEFFRIFFRKKAFRFRCTCELNSHLVHNKLLFDHVQHITVHWCGPDAANAFEMLAKCPKLEHLTIGLSRGTFAHLNERSALMKSFFPLSFRTVRLSDIMGMDELLKIRGLKQVEVIHSNTNRGGPIAIEMDRANLSELLCTRLIQPKEDDDEEFM